jgi:protein phosphatase
MLLTS